MGINTIVLLICSFDIFFSAKSERTDISESPNVVEDQSADAAIKVGSRVMVNLANGATFATVRWIGLVPHKSYRMAGLELVLITTDLIWQHCEICYPVGNPLDSFQALCCVAFAYTTMT